MKISEESTHEKTPVRQKDGGVFSFIPARYAVATMYLLGITLQYTIKVSLSVAIVAMVQSVPSSSSDSQQLRDMTTMAVGSEEELDVCPGGNEGSDSGSQEGEFEWDEATQGYMLSAYYYGYVTTQLLGGRLSEMYGTKVVLGPGVFIAGVLTLLSPMAARLGVGAFIADRVLVGAASGVVIPAMNRALPTWFVPEERTFLGTISMTGMAIGTILAMTLSGVLADVGGWPLVFYFFGGISVVFIIPWMFLVYDSPDKHPRISEKEKSFVLNGTGQRTEDKKVPQRVPWVSILMSGPMWIHVIMGISYGWVSYTLLSELPTYLSKILHYNLKESGALSAMPYIFNAIGGISLSYLSRWLQSSGHLSKLTTYKVFNTISAVGAAMGLLIITFVSCDSTAILILIAFTLTCLPAYLGGSQFNHVDLASNYAGTLAGIHLTFMNSMGFISPTVTGALTEGKQTLGQWKIVFYIAIAVGLSTWFVYTLFGSVEEQPWNRPGSVESQESPRNSKQKETV